MIPYQCVGCVKVETHDPPKTVMPRLICGNVVWAPAICEDCKRDLEGHLQSAYWAWLGERNQAVVASNA